MAQTMMCDLCENNPAQVLITVIATGDVQAIDANCMADFCLAYVKNIAPELLEAEAPKPRSKSRKAPARPVADDSTGNQGEAAANGSKAG